MAWPEPLRHSVEVAAAPISGRHEPDLIVGEDMDGPRRESIESTSSALPYVGLVMALVVLLGMFAYSYWSFLQSLKVFEQVMHKEEEFDKYLRLFADIKEAEDWQREYLLTGELQYLAPYQVAVARVGQQLRRMEARSLHDQAGSARLREMKGLATKRLDLLQLVIDARDKEGLAAALAIVRSGRGAAVRNQIRELMLRLELEDMTLLKAQHDHAHETAAQTVVALTSVMVLFVVVAVASVLRIRRDLDARRRLERRLLEEAKLAEIARLLGDIGHDVKNMLMPIISGAELLHEDLANHFTRLPEPEAAKAKATRALSHDVLEMTRNSSRRIQERVREIADAVKGRTAPLSLAPCDLARVVANVYATLGLFAQERGVSLQAVGLDKLPAIRADERRLFNALYNLVNNAIPEVPAGGSVSVRGEEDAAALAVVLAVIDTGRGMPPEVRDSLFGYGAVSRKSGGTGLGTKIVKDVVEAHGGTITVDSQEGVGTTFTLRLPIAGPRAQPA